MTALSNAAVLRCCHSYVSLRAGLGLFEYMQLAEDLGAEPVWVVNNGVSHEESVPAGRIQSWVQDALDSIECGCWHASLYSLHWLRCMHCVCMNDRLDSALH